jgi:hypothetical protein
MANLRLCSLLAILVLWPASAWAECSLVGTLVRVDVLDEGRKGVHTLYAREFQTDPHYYVFETRNQLIASEALALAAMHTQVEIVGDEFSCPSDGQIRFGGDIRRLTVGP